MPAQDRVGSHDRRDPREESAAESLALAGKATALVVGQAQTPATELLPQHAVLLDQVVDGLGLLAVDPARERGKKQPE